MHVDGVAIDVCLYVSVFVTQVDGVAIGEDLARAKQLILGEIGICMCVCVCVCVCAHPGRDRYI